MRALLAALTALALSAGSSADPVYSSQYRLQWIGGLDTCKGPVQKSNSGYYYCYVDYEDEKWDYCSPDPQDPKFARPLLNIPFSLEGGPCKDACTWSSSDNKYMCHSYWNDYIACDQKFWAFFKSYTYEGEECFGTCDKHLGKKYYWCRNERHEEKYCSPYKLNPQEHKVLDLMKSVPKCDTNDMCVDSHATRKKRQVTLCPADANVVGSVEAYITTLAAIAAASSVYFYSQPNQQEGIYRYAYMQPITPGSPTLPLVISARITSNTIRNPGTRERIPTAIQNNIVAMGSYRGRQDANDDENGHLIASENGGPTVVYNFAPQPRSLNRGMLSGSEFRRMSDWRRNEDNIRDWVQSMAGRRVDQTVVVVYETVNGIVNPRPVGFAQRIVYYHPNGTVRFECQDYYSNDPLDNPDLNPVSP